MRIKSVIFDLDGTLLDRDKSIEQFIRSQRHRLLPNLPPSQWATRFIELDDGGKVWKDKVYQTLVAEFGIQELTWRDLLEDYENNFKRMSEKSKIIRSRPKKLSLH